MARRRDWRWWLLVLAAFGAPAAAVEIDGRIEPDEWAGARQVVEEHGLLTLHPLCGGLDPEVAWPYLRRAVAALDA